MDSLAIPEDYKVEILHDQSIEINQSVHSMLREVFLGAFMTVLITLLFLKKIFVRLLLPSSQSQFQFLHLFFG